ncbi:MAG: XrtA/PEP-CTERM system-associated ATPase [Pseudomonadota bacterium]
MYEEYFGLSGAPFKLSPDPKFFFGSRSHNKAMAYLHYGLKQAEGFIVITGPVGAGKSMLIGHLLDQLNRSNVVAAHLLTSNVEPSELLSHILSAFRIAPEGKGRAGELEAFEDYLFDQLNRGRRVLLILDEAQNLPHNTLEELRMLSNIDYDGTPLFQVFLVGQPEFRDTLAADNMEQLKQRVIASYHLEDLSQDETREYIEHRLSVAGWKNDPSFTPEAYELVHDETKGRPRRINTLCNRLMLYCSIEKRNDVDADVVRTVIAELEDEQLQAGPVRKKKPVEKVTAKAPAQEAPPAPLVAVKSDAQKAADEKAKPAEKPREKKSEEERKPAKNAAAPAASVNRMPPAKKAASAGKKPVPNGAAAPEKKSAANPASKSDIVKPVQAKPETPPKAAPVNAAPSKSASTKPAAAKTPPAPAKTAEAAPSGDSVFDRLRAQRAGAATPAQGASPESPASATVKDVATASAAVSETPASYERAASEEKPQK